MYYNNLNCLQKFVNKKNRKQIYKQLKSLITTILLLFVYTVYKSFI
jgi:hypothetical protein